MSVWFVCPSKRPPAECAPIFQLWLDRGYRIAIAVDSPEEAEQKHAMVNALISSPDGYRGYAKTINALAEFILDKDPDCQWIVAAGDDTEPDANHSAEEIAQQCVDHFEARHQAGCLAGREFPLYLIEQLVGTWGVMQPTGDRWGTHANASDPKIRSAYIDRVAGSPWLGREFCLRINQGNGPLWPEYYHMYADEELQNVATRLGVFWQRPDLIHLHKHWGRAREGERMAPRSRMPQFLERANSAEEWERGKRLFAEREAAGFPGSEPL